jgi:hypothetical protein
MEQMVASRGFIGFLKASAKERTNIDEAVLTLVNYIHRNNIEPAEGPESVPIDPTDKKPRWKCCK